MRFSTFFLIVAGALFAISPNAAMARDVKADAGLNNKCANSWSRLWPLAKQGNINARGELLVEMSTIFRKMPGRLDFVNTLSDLQILGVHALGATDDLSAGIAISFASQLVELSLIPGEEELEACIKDIPSQECARIAVQRGLVPSFGEYAGQIDVLIASGRESICLGAVHKRIKGVQ